MSSVRSDSVKEFVLEKGTKNKKEKKLRLYMHPPSIPTRFQTIHYDDGESKGFSSTSKRFTYKLNDLPGPGYYAKAAETVDEGFSLVSISKKGYGVGFASHSRRFKNAFGVQDQFSTVSPAKYKPSTPTYSQSLSNSVSPAFRKPVYIAAGLPGPCVRTKTGIKPTPGPGEYAPEKTSCKPTAKGAESSFKSKSSRTMQTTGMIRKTEDQEDAPPPKSTTPEKEKAILPTSSFKASSRNHHDKPKIGPSIGQYDVAEKKVPRAPTRPPVKFKMIATAPAKPTNPTSIQTSIPGSGMTPIAFPSPGRYDLARGAEMMSHHRQAPAPSLGKSKRFLGGPGPQTDAARMPGPGSYRPYIDGRHKSFHLNLHGQWS